MYLPNKTKGVSHGGLASSNKKYLKAKGKNSANSNISQCKNITCKESSKKEPKSFKILSRYN
jgi:hypothetical protein